LHKRGHSVVLCSNSQHKEKVESFGLAFAPLRPTVPEGMAARRIIERAMHPWRGSQWLFQSFLDPAVRDTFSDLE
ncbi:hypothetical protein, partial [Enterobacter hormaechei]|uniref:hypothetical protein n=1 Tax=Enterobacter hormaechei TaxID=158836 RepID=UPI0019545648